MKLSLDERQLSTYVSKQLNSFFPDHDVYSDDLIPGTRMALGRCEHAFKYSKSRYLFDNAEVVFNHLHTDQYAMFLYFLSNSLLRLNCDLSIATKIYGLNKALHAVDVHYEVQLPDIFFWQHPIGTVLGRAKYSNYLFLYQHCTIGGNLNGVYPTIGEGVVLYGNSALIGSTTVGENVWFSYGTVAMDEFIPSNSIVFGRSPSIIMRQASKNVSRDLFRMVNN